LFRNSNILTYKLIFNISCIKSEFFLLNTCCLILFHELCCVKARTQFKRETLFIYEDCLILYEIRYGTIVYMYVRNFLFNIIYDIEFFILKIQEEIQ